MSYLFSGVMSPYLGYGKKSYVTGYTENLVVERQLRT